MNSLDLILKKCDILYENELISKESILITFSDFLVKTLEREKHNVQLVLHPGSDCFNAMIIIFSTLFTYLNNEITPDHLISLLKKGDMVIYGSSTKRRYIFLGFEKCDSNYCKGDMVTLEELGGSRFFVPYEKWKYIEPYYGDSNNLGGIGINQHIESNIDFLEEIFGETGINFSSVINNSSVIVGPFHIIKDIISKISFKCKNKSYNLLDLITVSFFSDLKEYRFGGNISKNEPVLKIVSNISKARELILSEENNKVSCLSLLNENIITKGGTELEELINRVSLRNVIISSRIDSSCYEMILNNTKDLNVFPCTKDFLQVFHNQIEGNLICCDLNSKIEAIVQRSINKIIINTPIDNDEYLLFRNNLLNVKNSSIEESIKHQFVTLAYSVANILSTSFFSIKQMEQAISESIISILSISERIERLYLLADGMVGSIQEKALEIIIFLENLKNQFEISNPKGDCLSKLLNRNKDNQIIIVLPKLYYFDLIVIHNELKKYIDQDNVCFTTKNRFDTSVSYDEVVYLGVSIQAKFDSKILKAGKKHTFIIYNFENDRFEKMQENRNHFIQLLNYKSLISIPLNEDQNQISLPKNKFPEISESKQEDPISVELFEYINQVSLSSISELVKHHETVNSSFVKFVGSLINGDSIFFTREYHAYVYDSINLCVTEKKVEDLLPGDYLIFTNNDSKTKDIIDDIFEILTKTKKVDDEIKLSYKIVNNWKHNIRKYIQLNNITFKRFARRMSLLGVKRTGQAIRSWVDSHSHVVGPRDENAFLAVGEIINNEDMYCNYEKYVNATKIIRKTRKKILKAVEKAIMNEISDDSTNENIIQEVVSRNMDSLAQKLQLEKINEIELIKIPNKLTNHPISSEEYYAQI